MSAALVRMRRNMAALAVVLAAIFLASPAIASPAVAATADGVSSPATIPTGPTVIGVDGTRVNGSIPIISDVVGLFLNGVLNFNHGEYLNLPGFNVVIDDYPRSFGLLTMGGPNYDDSVAQGVAGAVAYIKLAQGGDPTVPVKLVCLSQGSDVCSQTNDQLRAAGYDQSNVTYILTGNVDNADGGLKVRIPYIGSRGIFIPGPGVTLGNATPTTGSDATIIQVSYEYDLFARAPQYPINLLADLNAAAGALLEHGNYSEADPYAPGTIVSTTPDGRITNIVIPVDEVPLITIARLFGLPKPIADIINPLLKAIIDTAYSPIPEGPGTYPTEAQPFRLLPTPEKFQADIENVQAGLQKSGEKLREAIESVLPKLPAPKAPPAPTSDVPEASAKSAQRSELKPISDPDPKSEPEPEPDPQPEQAPPAAHEPEPSPTVTGTQSEPKPEPEPETATADEPKATPEPQPRPKRRTAVDHVDAAASSIRDVVRDTVRTVTRPHHPRAQRDGDGHESHDVSGDNDHSDSSSNQSDSNGDKPAHRPHDRHDGDS